MLTDFEQNLLRTIQGGLPLSRTPYHDLADTLRISVDELLTVLRQWKASGRIRRVGAIVNHFRVGWGNGAMVVWSIPADRLDRVGQLFASFPNVSHVYQRPPRKQWPYNLYTMVHAGDDEELEKCIRTMSRRSRLTEFRTLKTVKELKKVQPTYIVEQ